MIRKDAISIIANKVGQNPIISANGYISRDLFQVCDKPTNFYMIGSMGLSSSIGLGIALKNPQKRIFVFDGDGNILMNLGSITTIGLMKPKNLFHIVFDNQSHESTGGQPTCTKKIHIEKIAKSVNYTVFKVENVKTLEKILQKIKRMLGPIMIVVKIESSDYVSKRVELKPIKIRDRFMNSLKRS